MREALPFLADRKTVGDVSFHIVTNGTHRIMEEIETR